MLNNRRVNKYLHVEDASEINWLTNLVNIRYLCSDVQFKDKNMHSSTLLMQARKIFRCIFSFICFIFACYKVASYFLP